MNHQNMDRSNTLQNIEKILIIRADGIGDMLNATPAIALIRQNYASAEIAVLARPLNAPVLHGNPHVDRVLVYESSRRTQSYYEKAQILPIYPT